MMMEEEEPVLRRSFGGLMNMSRSNHIPNMTVDQIVKLLLQSHLGWNDPLAVESIKDNRDLYRLGIHSLRQKQQLVKAAAETFCSGVIMDVLLFLSHTLSSELFNQIISPYSIVMDHWTNYLTQQCIINKESTMFSLRSYIDSCVAMGRFEDLATQLLSMAFLEESQSNNHIHKAIELGKEVLILLQQYEQKHQIPSFVTELLQEYIFFIEFQLKTDEKDMNHAPEVVQMAGYLDKRSRNKKNIQANWRKRYFQLEEKEIFYTKHDMEKIATSKNPFLDKRKRESVHLTRGLTVEKHYHIGKVFDRSFCIRLGAGLSTNKEEQQGDDGAGLLIDCFNEQDQEKWFKAIYGNVKRLDLDPVWVEFPRKSVLGMTMNEYLQYCLLYHNGSSSSSSSSSSSTEDPFHPTVVRDTFQIDDKRFLYASALSFAKTKQWIQLEELVTKASTSSHSKGPKLLFTMEQGPSIGYGPFIDIANQSKAPASLLLLLESLEQKVEVKKNNGWSCRSSQVDSTASSSSSTSGSGVSSSKIQIQIPDSVRTTESSSISED